LNEPASFATHKTAWLPEGELYPTLSLVRDCAEALTQWPTRKIKASKEAAAMFLEFIHVFLFQIATKILGSR
jgi:hypothetical protein